MSKFTPGPWPIVEKPTWPFDIEIGGILCIPRHAYSTVDKSVADVMAGRSFPVAQRAEVVAANTRQMADARLIAAAPELYEALSDLLAMREAHLNGNVHPKGELQIVATARAALAKADAS